MVIRRPRTTKITDRVDDYNQENKARLRGVRGVRKQQIRWVQVYLYRVDTKPQGLCKKGIIYSS
jgi:hypothetical protein